MTQETLTVTPATFEHAQRVYMQMLAEAKDDQELGRKVYEGHLTTLFKKLHLSVPYYTHIKNKLAGMGCIEQTRRGGGSGTSRWILWKEPNLGEWKAMEARRPMKGNKTLVMEQRIKDLFDTVRLLMNKVEYLEEAVEELKGKS